jgi:hypothetical protein
MKESMDLLAPIRATTLVLCDGDQLDRSCEKWQVIMLHKIKRRKTNLTDHILSSKTH